MSRPDLDPIQSGEESWDADVTDNFEKITEAPFPGYFAPDFTTLTNQFAPSLYDACQALVWDGTPGTSPTLYVSNGVSWVPPAASLPSGVLSTASKFHVEDSKGSGVHGGSFTAGIWQTRDLNVIRTNTIAGATLTSNQPFVPAGTYQFFAMSIANDVDVHQVRLYDITGTAVIKYGIVGGSSADTNTVSSVRGEVILSPASFLELQHRCTTGILTTGLGRGATFGNENIYSSLELWKTG